MLYLAVNACHHLVFAVFFCVEHDDTTVIMIMTEKNAWVMANSLFTVLLVCWGNPTVKAVGTVADVVGFLGWGFAIMP